MNRKSSHLVRDEGFFYLLRHRVGLERKNKPVRSSLPGVTGMVESFWPLAISQFRFNSAGITYTMKKPEHYNLVVFYPKAKSIRKSPKQTTPEFFMDL